MYNPEKCDKCSPEDHTGSFCRCKSRNIAIASQGLMMKWNKFEKRIWNPCEKDSFPYDGQPFLACVWGEWVGMAIYARHYDTPENKAPGKYEFFYVTQNPEEEGWKIPIEQEPFPITHFMSLPKPPEEK